MKSLMESHIKNLLDNQQSIEQVADALILKFPDFVYELSKVISRQFRENRNSDKKNTCIALICLILKKSNITDSSRKFVKGLAQRLRYFLQDLTRNYVSEGIALSINRNVESLKLTGLFSDEYFQKLQVLAKRIKENSNPESQNMFLKSQSFEQDQRKYSRNFLHKIREINKNQSIRAIYDTWVEFNRVMNENIEKSSDLQNSQRQLLNDLKIGKFQRKQGNIEKNAEQRGSRKERLENIIQECHSHILYNKLSMEDEMRRYEDILTLTNLDRMESHCTFFFRNQIQLKNDNDIQTARNAKEQCFCCLK